MTVRGYIRPFLILLLIVILISTGSVSIYAKNDSAVAVLEERCYASMKNFNYRQLGADASRLLKLLEGKSPHSRELGYANLYKGVAVMMGDNGSEAYPYLDRALEAGRVIGNDSLVALSLNSLGIYEANVNANLYLAQRYFMQSSEAADKVGYTNVKNGVKSNLAEVAAMLDDTDGIKYASWSYKNAVAENDSHGKSVAAGILARLYNIKGDTAMARRYIVIARNIADSCRFEENGELLLEEAKIEEKAGDIEKAIKCVERSIPLLTGQHSHSLPDAYLRLGNLQYFKGDYTSALENADFGIGACKKYSANLQLGKLYKLKSDCFMQIGQPDSAVVYLRKANIQIEKGNALQLQHLENERRMMAEMDEKDKKAAVTQVRMSFQSRLIVALVVSVLLMGICLTVVIYNHRRRKRLYDSLVRKNQETLALVDRLRSETEEGRNRSAVVFSDDIMLAREVEEDTPEETIPAEEEQTQSTSEESSREKGISREKGTLLFEEACRLMREERLYADPRFTREDFIERLGTNHTYFTQLIKDFTGANFTQFLNSYRIEEAIRILSDPEQRDCPLKQVCSDVGFGSVTSFYKFFQAATGVTPSIYRKTVLEKK